MPSQPSRADALAQQLLDAQVAHHLDRLTGARLPTTVAALADDLLSAAGGHQLEDLVDRTVVTRIAVGGLTSIPASAAMSGLVELVTTVLFEGPDEPYPLGELAERTEVEALVDSVLALNPVLERFVDGLADVPLVGTVASRFMGRVVGDVLQANKALADRVPGLGSLMSFGSSAASRMVGAADRQLEGLIGDTMGKGGAYAVRRLNRIVVETLRDPVTRAAAMEAWDLLAQEPVTGLDRHATHEQVAGVADAVHDVAITALATEHAARLVEVLVDGFFDRFGGFTPVELLEELDLERADVVADLVALAPAVVDALRDSGDLERLLRSQLEPFFTSPEVVAMLSGPHPED
ncbi:MAG: hypothetical protein U0R80_20705 [Nocardioidaceae bacterium]